MKKFFPWLLTIVLLTLLSPSAHAQSATKIIDRHIKAVGGKKILKTITTTNFIGTVTNPATGETGLFNWQRKAPNRTYTETIWPDARWSEAFNGKSAWRLDTAGGLRTLTGQDGARVKATAVYRNDRFLAYKKEKTRVQWLGQQTVRDRPAHVIELTTRTGIKRQVFFDAETYLILKEEQPGESGTEEMFFDDYRPVDGVMEPFRIQMRRGGELLEIAITQMTHNTPIADEVFNFPKMSDEPLPDIAALLDEVKNNQRRVDEIKEYYTCIETESDLEFDKNGQLKEKSERAYEVFYLGGRRVRKLVKKDGRELSQKDQQEEQERVEKIIREHEERQKKEAERRAKAERERQKAIAEGKTPKPEKEEENWISVCLRVCQFTNPRHERFRGQEVIVFDFEPKPGYKAQNSNERFLQKLVGVLWIDERAHQAVRVEARLNDKFKMAGGLLVSIQRGSAFVAEQEMVNNEVWLPSYSEVNMSAKVFIFAGINLNRVRRYRDYKKFRVESEYEIKPPAPQTPLDH